MFSTFYVWTVSKYFVFLEKEIQRMRRKIDAQKKNILRTWAIDVSFIKF